MRKQGFLIVFEGLDGSGKTTQARSLLRKLRARGVAAAFFREPSRGTWGRLIRKAALRADSLTPEEELDLFIKDRRDDLARNIEPALEAGKVVILDRYYFSTIAYQGAKGIDPARIRRMNERFAVRPDLVVILDIEAGKGLSRIDGRGRKDELFEREDYLIRVRKIFDGFRGRAFVHIDGAGDRARIGAEILDRVLTLLRRPTRGSSRPRTSGRAR